MEVVNIEIKAHCRAPENIIKVLESLNADYKGEDHQVDTYFNVNQGRLKLRQGNIEHSLIFYDRAETKGLKQSDVIYDKLQQNSDVLKEQLSRSIGIKVVVDKKRRIYFIDNVKFHVDRVKGLSSFVEIEAIGKKGEEEQLAEQCSFYMKQLAIVEDDLIDQSYSDMIENA